MVSVNPSPTQGFYFFDPMNRGSKAMAQSVEGNKKVRKPYKITKSRESWTELEHDLFIEALHLFDRDWKKIEAFVGSKTVIQIRSHAQKYFLKVQKNNTSEHLPPPRPKRKAARPYPQKALKDGPVVSQENLQHPAPSSFIEPGCRISSNVLGNTLATTSISAWSHNSLAVSTLQLPKDDDRISDPMIPNHCCSNVSTDSTPISWPNSWAIDDRNPQMPLRVMPDFAEVYRFIGSIFDPDTSDHLERLKEMDPINLETALLLMRNLCTNLMNPAFEKHRKILGVYNDAPEKENSGIPFDLKCPSVILSA